MAELGRLAMDGLMSPTATEAYLSRPGAPQLSQW